MAASVNLTRTTLFFALFSLVVVVAEVADSAPAPLAKAVAFCSSDCWDRDQDLAAAEGLLL